MTKTRYSLFTPLFAVLALLAAAGAPVRALAQDDDHRRIAALEAKLANELVELQLLLAYSDQINRITVAQGGISAADADARLRGDGERLYQTDFGDAQLAALKAQHRQAVTAYFEAVSATVSSSQRWPGNAEAYRIISNEVLASVRANYPKWLDQNLDPLPLLEQAAKVAGWARGEANPQSPFAGQRDRVLAAVPDAKARGVLNASDPATTVAAPPQMPPPRPAVSTAPPPRPETPTAPIYVEIQRTNQAESRDTAGRITVEASIVHQLACRGAGGAQWKVLVYEYTNRREFRAIQPPNWGSPIGGHDFPSFAEAVAAGCRSPPAR